MKSKDVKLFGAFITTLILMGIAVSATTVGPYGIYDSPFFNGTLVNVEQVFINSINYTQTIIDATGESGIAQLPADYIIYQTGSTYHQINSSGVTEGTSTDPDDVFNWAEGNISTTGKIYVATGDYELDSWTGTANLVIEGAGKEQTRIKVTANSGAIVMSGNTTWKNLELWSNVDGNHHIQLNGDATFENVRHNYQLDTTAIRGVIRGGRIDGTYRFLDNELIGGKTGATRFSLFTLGENTDTFEIDGLTIINITVDYTAGISRLVTQEAAETLRDSTQKDIDILFWRAGGGNDAGIIYTNDPIGETALIEDINFIYADFNSATDQQLEISPIAHYMTYLNNKFLYPSHLYGGDRVTIVDNLILIGSIGVWSAFDLPVTVAAEEWKYAEFNNIYLENATLTINSRFRKVIINNIIQIDSRIVISDENAAGVAKEVFITNQQVNNSNGQFDDAIVFQQMDDWGPTLIHVTNADYKGCNDIIQSGSSPTSPVKIILDKIVVHDYGSGNKPQLFNIPARTDDNLTIWLFDSDLEIDQPPFDDMNPIRPQDRTRGNVYMDIDTDEITHSEYLVNWTIPVDGSNIEVAHNLSMRGPYSSIQLTATSALGNQTYMWTDYASFNHTHFIVRVGNDGAEEATDAEITGLAYARETP